MLVMKASRETVLAIIPVYMEEKFIGDVVSRVLEHVTSVLVVDDGSLDHTAVTAEAAGATVIRHAINKGKGAALKSGMARAAASGTPYLLFLDGDGQHDPADIPAFFNVMNESE